MNKPTRVVVDEVPLALLLQLDVVRGDLVTAAVVACSVVVEGDAVGRALLRDGARLATHRQLLYLALREERMANTFESGVIW